MVQIASLALLGFGYLVYAGAEKEKKNTKFLGKGIGLLIMISAIITMLFSSISCAYQNGCPFSKKSMCPMMTCPMSGKLAK